ncbi:hypothetical protein AGLY_013870 [Aphis glycines]|uniref:Uncharacterized protein n=1 Tax=Aphis glycines TaxID=307491 RepID=A0A6G0T7F4_APHGL|nr:hypothetical protein AGLY_013870 [Aphis glycines]
MYIIKFKFNMEIEYRLHINIFIFVLNLWHIRSEFVDQIIFDKNHQRKLYKLTRYATSVVFCVASSKFFLIINSTFTLYSKIRFFYKCDANCVLTANKNIIVTYQKIKINIQVFGEDINPFQHFLEFRVLSDYEIFYKNKTFTITCILHAQQKKVMWDMEYDKHRNINSVVYSLPRHTQYLRNLYIAVYCSTTRRSVIGECRLIGLQTPFNERSSIKRG